MKQLSLSPIKPKIKGLALGIRIRQLHHARIQFPSRFAGEHICTLKNITAKIVPFHFSSNQRTFPVHPTKGMILMLSGLIEFQESPILKIPSSALSRNYCRERKNTMSYLLVFLQFFLLGVIAYPFGAPHFGAFNIVLFAGGLAVLAMAARAMPLKTFTVMPEPRSGGELVTRGIYRQIRHPMYLAVLLCAIGAALAYDSSLKWLAVAALGAVLAVKVRREEALLMKRFEGYEEYRKSSKAILPFLY